MTRPPLAAVLALVVLSTGLIWSGCDGGAPKAGSAGGPSGTTGPSLPEGARTLKHIEALAASPRVAGTASSDPATKYVSEQFAASGYAVESMPFTFESGSGLRPGTIAVGGVHVEATSLGGGAGGKVTAVPVFVGLADDAGLAGKNLDGNIAVADRGSLQFGEKYDNVTSRGALALVVINNVDGNVSGTLGKNVDLPAVAVSQQSGDLFRNAAKAGTPITIDMPLVTSLTGTNLIARQKASAKCEVLIGGHRDSVPGTGGANDNASGVAAVVELARAFAADGLDDGLCFAAFDAEEEGLYGSRALAKRMQSDGILPKVFINLDDAGAGQVIELIGTDSVTERFADSSRRLGINSVVTTLPPNTASDHVSFEAVGVPVILIGGDDFSNIHTARDTVDKLNPQLVDDIGKLTYAVAKVYLADIAAGRL